MTHLPVIRGVIVTKKTIKPIIHEADVLGASVRFHAAETLRPCEVGNMLRFREVVR